jgi:hypothetical protein
MDLGIERFRGLAELHPPQLVQLRFVLLDKQMSARQFGACRGKFGLAFGELVTQISDL